MINTTWFVLLAFLLAGIAASAAEGPFENFLQSPAWQVLREKGLLLI